MTPSRRFVRCLRMIPGIERNGTSWSCALGRMDGGGSKAVNLQKGEKRNTLSDRALRSMGWAERRGKTNHLSKPSGGSELNILRY